jgi:hypothetical protein
MVDLDDVGCVMDVDTLDDLQRVQAVLFSRQA